MVAHSGVYEPVDKSEKQEFWAELAAIGGLRDDPWCVMGDFNAIRLFEDMNQGRLYRKEMDWFNELIDNSSLVVFDMEGHKFTYSNKRSTPTLSRIDKSTGNC